LAVVAATSALAGPGCRGSTAPSTAGFWYDDTPFALPAITEAIGRGIGRVAAHEFAHQILNAGAVHDHTDENSDEFQSPDRASQYDGELHWTTARPLLEQTLR
jgi:hypothetical protein